MWRKQLVGWVCYSSGIASMVHSRSLERATLSRFYLWIHGSNIRLSHAGLYLIFGLMVDHLYDNNPQGLNTYRFVIYIIRKSLVQKAPLFANGPWNPHHLRLGVSADSGAVVTSNTIHSNPILIYRRLIPSPNLCVVHPDNLISSVIYN